MKKIYTIGRDESCDIVISDSTNVISRQHATIRVESNDKIFIIDQSRNGTYINGMKMSSNVEIPISRNDVVSFAHVYNLDWSLVPAEKNTTLKIVLASVVSIAIIGTVAWLIFFNDNKKSPEPTPKTQVETPSEVTPETQIENQDSVINETPIETEVVKESKPIATPIKQKPIKKAEPKNDSEEKDNTEENIGHMPLY